MCCMLTCHPFPPSPCMDLDPGTILECFYFNQCCFSGLYGTSSLENLQTNCISCKSLMRRYLAYQIYMLYMHIVIQVRQSRACFEQTYLLKSEQSTGNKILKGSMKNTRQQFSYFCLKDKLPISFNNIAQKSQY